MARLDSDLLPVLVAACDGQLDQVSLRWKPEASLTVVMAANGYPGAYKKGTVIRGLEKVKTAKVRGGWLGWVGGGRGAVGGGWRSGA